MAPDPRASEAMSRDGVQVRVDAMALSITHADVDGTRYQVLPAGRLLASSRPVLPWFAGWGPRAAVALSLRGVADRAFDAQLEIAGTRAGPLVAAVLDATTGDFTVDLAVPVGDLALPADGAPVRIALVAGGRSLGLLHARFVPVPGSAPLVRAFDVREATDSVLFNAPERKLFDLQNPEEGFWTGTGRWRLRVALAWTKPSDGAAWSLEPMPVTLSLETPDGGLVREDATQRRGGEATLAECWLDTSHPTLRTRVPPEGLDLTVPLSGEQTLSLAGTTLRLLWSRPFALRVRDPAAALQSFKRLSAVGIDFGTTATVAAFTHRGFRSLMRLGAPDEDRDPTAHPAENPTYLLIDDHERLWATMASRTETADEGARRFPDLVGVVQASYPAREQISEAPNAVVGEIKSLPERVILLDQSPQLRDRARHADFLLDEARVRMLVRAYAYLLGRAINRPGQDVYLQYWLTYPAEFDERARVLLEEEIRAGILLSIPEGIAASDVVVGMRATEPEAYAAEVCPELVGHPEIEALVAKHGELRFAVFDFGGGTLDIACGRYRAATEAEQAQSGCSSVIETLQVGGNDHLGGDYLTHEMVWLLHQHDEVLPEMEHKDVPMQRPQTIPENKLARHAHLYKRSLAGRQNKIRFERELGVERLKFARDRALERPAQLTAARLDGTTVTVDTPREGRATVRERLVQHLEERIEDGARMLASMLAGTAWGGATGSGTWREQGVVILLAGNSSRSEYVERALGNALGIEGLKVWRPGASPSVPFQGVVQYETPTRRERGVEILGVTPKTAVALGALKIANREVHLLRAAQGFSYFVGDMKGFPPRFVALLPMGTPPANAAEWGAHYIEFGTWDAQKPLRVATEFDPGRMTSSDPRLLAIPTGLPPGATGRLFVCVVSATKIGLHLAMDGERFVRSELNLAPYLG